MAALEHKIQGRGRQRLLDQRRRLCLIDRKELLETLRVGRFKVVMALSLLKGQPDLPIGALGIPAQIPDAFDVLEISR